jgi:1,4-dihydroxy-2-naphthoate octaprenyltransferase
MKDIKIYFIATRPWSYSMTFISILLGSLVAFKTGSFSLIAFIITIFGGILIHGATNVLNDYFDTKYKVDTEIAPTTRYRPHPIIGGYLSKSEVLVESLIMYFLAFICGLILIVYFSSKIIYICIIGLLISIFYTGKPISLKYRALGELAVFVIWGPLMVSGAYIVQRDMFSLDALLISIPQGLLVALVLFANNARDTKYDESRKIKTIGMLQSGERNIKIFILFLGFTYIYTLFMILFNIVSPVGIIVFLSIPVAITLLKKFKNSFTDDADALTAKLVNIYGGLLCITLLLEKIIY